MSRRGRFCFVDIQEVHARGIRKWGTVLFSVFQQTTEDELQCAANVKILKTAMETEKAIANDLLESMDISEYIDVYA